MDENLEPDLCEMMHLLCICSDRQKRCPRGVFLCATSTVLRGVPPHCSNDRRLLTHRTHRASVAVLSGGKAKSSRPARC